MSFQDKDKELQAKVLRELTLCQNINMNKDVGVAYLQPEWEDRVNPSVVLSREEIKHQTGRHKLRDQVLQDYQAALSGTGIISEIVPEGIKVSLVPERLKSNQHQSLSSLQRFNSKNLDEDPELGDPPF